MLNQNQNDDFPSYWNLLTTKDKDNYINLKKEIEPFLYRATKEKLKNQFRIILDKIKQYVFQHDGNDSIRSLICGVIWISDGIAVCNRNLSKLIAKCKSSINSGLLNLGYKNSSITPEHATELAKLFPFMKGNCCEMRQWTSRINEAEACNCKMLFESYFEYGYMQKTVENTHDTNYLLFQTDDEFSFNGDENFSDFNIELDFLDV